MSVIFPGNYVSHLNAYREQGVAALPGIPFVSKDALRPGIPPFLGFCSLLEDEGVLPHLLTDMGCL